MTSELRARRRQAIIDYISNPDTSEATQDAYAMVMESIEHAICHCKNPERLVQFLRLVTSSLEATLDEVT